MDDDAIPDDDEFLDSTGIDFSEDRVDDADLDLVILSVNGDPEKLAEYAALFPGAVGDGVTDNTAAFQRAIDRAAGK